MRSDYPKKMAVCGIMAALAIVIMALGGIIPIATYVCPVLCTLLGNIILRLCGKRLAWVWYFAVSVLSLFLAPDKEAAVVYVFIGFYPYIKSHFDRIKIGLFLKLVFFNATILFAYGLLMRFFGLTEAVQVYSEMGIVGIVITLILGNVTFLMLDALLGRRIKRK